MATSWERNPGDIAWNPDEAEAIKTLQILDEMGVMTPELMTMGPGMSEPAVISDDDPSIMVFNPALPAATMGERPS